MYEILRMAHLIMIAMVTGMAVSHYVLLRASAGREGEGGRALALARRTLGNFTTMVLAFVWLTGVLLLWSHYGMTEREVSAWFYVKILFVVVLTAAHIAQRVTAGGMRGITIEGRRIIERYVSIVWLSALLSICFAVISFTPSQ
ncbi:hypothetical protein [Afifella marina]|uniref:Protoporphyrinogen IX oxidase n=1 Tax=Afifella marina DSM 2698 TaxID=1120955 RepID=A0A1G5P794_AFIMA|nr:hypothetical protein [Afifella marina]MBK1625182.1 hypothetical protein [Afifella marina DSM 2698]MBK1627086.1 hypothetical protein [Afifella marina]MBK5919423.1 hypothetical protein [Afifella marina]RAI19639.1 hypothetical protein CH311_12645 [Afifella marina DSM 2698]SCZ44941.1 hypothetical protein SAMN03080610_03327 [Afifella marina DSM 2698]